MKFKKLDPEAVEWIIVRSFEKDATATSLNRKARSKGRLDFGYHFVITKHGEIQSVRNLDEVGDHAPSLNEISIAIAMAGLDFNDDQRAALGALLRKILVWYPKGKLYSWSMPEPIYEWAKETGVIDAI